MNIKQDVYEVLKQCTISEDGLSLYLPDIKMDRKLYTDTNKILESFGLKWNTKAKAHLSKEDISDKFYNTIDTGEWLDIKKELQYFPTPLKLAQQMADKVDWSKVKTILEPSCGMGGIVQAIPEGEYKLKLLEINSEFVDKLRDKYDIECVDFMEWKSDTKFDLILANPPFSKLQDIKHFNKMIEHLADGGQLVCILSRGSYDENSNIKLRQEFTKFVDENCEIEFIDGGEFKESGTNIPTIMVRYVK